MSIILLLKSKKGIDRLQSLFDAALSGDADWVASAAQACKEEAIVQEKIDRFLEIDGQPGEIKHKWTPT